METIKLIEVEVAYADGDQQQVLVVTLPEGSTIENAIDRSGILLQFPEINLMQQKVGIFSQQKSLSHPVCAGDRVEIYRPLLIDPKELRKKRI